MDKGLEILYGTYWSSSGWKNGEINKDDFLLAKEEGYMFDYPKVKSHQETLKELTKDLKQVNYDDTVNAFYIAFQQEN